MWKIRYTTVIGWGREGWGWGVEVGGLGSGESGPGSWGRGVEIEGVGLGGSKGVGVRGLIGVGGLGRMFHLPSKAEVHRSTDDTGNC